MREIILGRWDMEDLDKGRTVETIVNGVDVVIRRQTQEEEDRDNRLIEAYTPPPHPWGIGIIKKGEAP